MLNTINEVEEWMNAHDIANVTSACQNEEFCKSINPNIINDLVNYEMKLNGLTLDATNPNFTGNWSVMKRQYMEISAGLRDKFNSLIIKGRSK